MHINTKDIKNRIVQLEGGKFQNMCNEMLFKMGYTNINQLGSHTLSDKTTSGTPDTFIKYGEKYISVGYTTQNSGEFNKIKTDIENILNECKRANIEPSKAEIFYFHTSSNIDLAQTTQLEDICGGTKLEIYGIDRIAYYLKEYYPLIAKEYLGIEADTLQIMEINDFINQYNSNKITVKINDRLLYRDDEINELKFNIDNNDVVIVSGPAGIGKTHFVLECCKKYQLEHPTTKAYCINNRNMYLYDDLLKYLNDDGEYLLLLDDANMLSNIDQVLQYINSSHNKIIKIVATVRDYAKEKVIKKFKNYFNPVLYTLQNLTKEQLTDILKEEFNIKNREYIDRILKLSAGNARVTMMAATLVLNKNDIFRIITGEQLYEAYYDKIIDELEQKNSQVIKCAAILSFFQNVNRNDTNFREILNYVGISIEDFWDCMNILHEYEIVDILNDKIVKISEQCIINYFLYIGFIKKELVSLETMIEATFNKYKGKIVESLNLLGSVFNNDLTLKKIDNSIKNIWSRLSTVPNINRNAFCETFYQVIELECLKIINEEISVMTPENIELSVETDLKKKNNTNEINDRLITMLSQSIYSKEFDTALELLLEYIKKKSSVIEDMFVCFTNRFGINRDAIRSNYEYQIKMFGAMKNASDDWSNTNITILFLNVVPTYLELNGSYCESNSLKSITIINYSLSFTSELKRLRDIILNELNNIYEKNKDFRKKVLDIYNNLYNNQSNKDIRKVMMSDLGSIEKFVSLLNKNEFNDCMVVAKLVQELSIHKINIKSDTTIFTENTVYKAYKLLKIGNRDYYNKNALARIKTFVNKADDDEIIELIKNTSEINKAITNGDYHISHGVSLLFEQLVLSEHKLDEIIITYLNIGEPFNININQVVQTLMTRYELSYVKSIITNATQNRFRWEIEYYRCISEEKITKSTLEELYNLIRSKSEINDGYLINLHFLVNYIKIDKYVFCNVLNILNEIYGNNEKDNSTFRLYAELLFNDYSENTPAFLINVFQSNLEILRKTYFRLLDSKRYSDYNGEYFLELLQHDSHFINEYVGWLNKEKHVIKVWYHHDQDQLSNIWKLNNCNEYVNSFISHAEQISQKDNPYLVETVLSLIFMNAKSEYTVKQDLWIDEYIQKYYNDKNKTKTIFSVICYFSQERRIKFIATFINKNTDYTVFDSLELEPSSRSWTGSELPVIDERIEYYGKVQQLMIGAKLLNHKSKITNIIKGLELYRQKVIEEEFVEM